MKERLVTAEVRHFSPSETAERLGVSVKALRVYERQGMVTPLRTAAGWRAYGPDEIARLHQILALKSLGLPLSRIAGLLSGKPVALDGLLALQEEVLAAHRQRLDRALKLVGAARAKLKAGEALSIDDLANLAKETTVSDQVTMNEQEWSDVFHPIAERHFSKDELQSLEARDPDFDQTETTAIWNALIVDCRTLMADGDPTSPAAMALAGRWMAQVEKFTQGDPKLFAKSAAMWKDALADPVSAPKLPLNPEMFAFIGKADAARKAAQS